jgi:hypothetical protein
MSSSGAEVVAISAGGWRGGVIWPAGAGAKQQYKPKRVSAQFREDKFMPEQLTLNVNGEDRRVAIAPDTPLLYVLRDNLGLHGPKFGCGLGECGACTVIMNGGRSAPA